MRCDICRLSPLFFQHYVTFHLLSNVVCNVIRVQFEHLLQCDPVNVAKYHIRMKNATS